jgi:nucleoside-triphosphatase
MTGRPGVGKTTVIQNVARELADLRPRGFWTEEIRRGGERQGFRLRTFDGAERVIASTRFSGAPRVGKYGVDVAAIDAVVADALAIDEGVDVWLVDEIGRMECLSAVFVTAMRALLGSGKLVVASVALRGGGLIEEAGRWRGARLWHVGRDNRDALPAEIARAVCDVRRTGRRVR